MTIEQINRTNFNDKTKGEKVLVEVFTPTCMPCKMVLSFLNNYTSHLPIFKLDATEEEVLASRFEITSVPTLLLFEQGKLVKTHTGYITPPDIEEFIGL